MSLTVVVAWMVRAGTPPAFFSALRIRPTVVPASRAAEVPAAAATVIGPASVRGTSVPPTASVTLMSPLTVRICASPPSRPAVMFPSVIVRRAVAASSTLTVACRCRG
jgi:hypothetical protein